MSYVYIATSDSRPGAIKVGFSNNPKRRAAELSKEYREVVEIADAWEVVGSRWSANSVERRTHNLLRNRRMRGEWFFVTIEEGARAIADAQRSIFSRRSGVA